MYSSAESLNLKDGSDKQILLIAFHYPPVGFSTGHLRTIGFARHLQTFGWQPTILTVRENAYERIVTEKPTNDIPGVKVYRAFGFDTKRTLGVRGRYPSWLAVPDRWISWWPAAIRTGLSVIRNRKIDVLWSTYPIMTSHLIGLTLSRMSGLPWVADFRDPVVAPEPGWLNQNVTLQLEKRIIQRATHLTFTTPSALSLYANRYQCNATTGRFSVIPNGFEESLFEALEGQSYPKNTFCTLVHSGLLYRDGRSPIPFFHALAQLQSRGLVDASQLRVVLRGSGNEEDYKKILSGLRLTDIVQLAPSVNYSDALREQAMADGLLLFQGSKFNVQIPAKVYEYLRIGRPILALTDPHGDTASLLKAAGNIVMASMTDEQEIAERLMVFLSQLRSNDFTGPNPLVVNGCSRRDGANKLADLLDDLVGDINEHSRNSFDCD